MKDVFRGVVSTLVAAGLIVGMKECFYDNTNINGRWGIETTVENSNYKKYKDLKLEYNFLLNQNGTTISGTGERVAEITTKKKVYAPKNRSNITINGSIEKRFFGTDIIYVFFNENYGARPTSTMLKFYYNDKDMKGEYSSTIADQSGSVTLTRKWY